MPAATPLLVKTLAAPVMGLVKTKLYGGSYVPRMLGPGRAAPAGVPVSTVAEFQNIRAI